jgi:hypothetical protein
MNAIQDYFISHSSSDKANYILPLVKALSARGVTYWLDAGEISWSQSIVAQINEGLRRTRRVLLCLSGNTIGKPWPEAEMDAAISRQNETGEQTVVPLILNSRDEVLAEYPLLRPLSYRLWDQGVDSIADELANIPTRKPKDGIHLRVESVNSGLLCDVVESPRVSVAWVIEKARQALGLEELVNIGPLALLPVVWALVDVKAEDHWLALPESEQREIKAIVRVGDEVKPTNSGTKTLLDLAVPNDTIFHLYGHTSGLSAASKSGFINSVL